MARVSPGQQIADAIASSGRSIYDLLEDRSDLVYPLGLLEARLASSLVGMSLPGPIRTRSLHAKTAVAAALGYKPPTSFARVRPRFPGQDLDVYVQRSDNLQIWNEDISPLRRYVILRTDGAARVVAVRVLTGAQLAELDRTGAFTDKYQAKRRLTSSDSVLCVGVDTANLRAALDPHDKVPAAVLRGMAATGRPVRGRVLSINAVWRRLDDLPETILEDPGIDQERVRGILVQRIVCDRLGIGTYADHGQFPDVLCQALEVKFQLASTIDLGLVSPDSEALATDLGMGLRHCDVRYVIVYGERLGPTRLCIRAYVVTTGEAFFSEFQRFEGRVVNRKLQIPLPAGLFARGS